MKKTGRRVRGHTVGMALFALLFSVGTAAPGSITAWAHWEQGEVIYREMDGVSYPFRCIDENYSDQMEHHRQAALFLCDVVIPADYGSRYEFETPQGQEHGYVFYPGPVVNFGESSEYKTSAIRGWLKEAGDFADAEPVNIGISYAYTGNSRDGSLTPHYIGSQKLTDRLFILSVDEAVKYQKWLWRFNGAQADNPQTQIGPACKGYWLRNPVGSWQAHDTDMEYIVDLVNGSIRPCRIAPERAGDADGAGEVPGSTTGVSGDAASEAISGRVAGEAFGGNMAGGRSVTDAELAVTSSAGIRPAFVLRQDPL